MYQMMTTLSAEGKSEEGSPLETYGFDKSIATVGFGGYLGQRDVSGKVFYPTAKE